jgi:ferredoxin
MILCFSGTGNSRFAAKLIGTVTGDVMVSANGLIKSGSKEALHSDKPFVFVCPTYAWRLPRVFERFIRETALTGSTRAYFVMTCGGETGNAARYIKRLCAVKGLEFMGLKSVLMPENYIALFEVPDKVKADEIIRKAVPEITSAAETIKSGLKLPEEKVRLLDRVYSTIVNPFFYPFVVHAKGFYATDACTGCGKCEALCPLNNITRASGRPAWGDRCTHCMACICACPAEAIEYKNHSKGKPRYYCGEA